MGQHVEVIVAGGGLVGATLALALADAGMAVVLVDAARPGDAPDPRASSVAYGGFRVWSALGLEARLESHVQPVMGIVVDAGEGAELAFDAAEVGSGDEPLGWMAENARVRTVLQDALLAAGVTILSGARVVKASADERGTTVDLADGRSFSANLVVAAEGRRSAVRESARIGVAIQAYGQTGLTATLGLKGSHQGLARQRFLPGGPLAILPLTADIDGDRASLVWSLPTAQAQALLAMPGPRFEAYLARRVGDLVGEARLIGPRAAFALSAQTAERLTAARTALVGDAAHAIHPIAGQGLNLGLKDVAALAEVLVEARRRGEDLGGDAVLERYAAWRRFDRAALTTGVDLVARLFSHAGEPARGVTRLAFAAAAKIPTLRRAMMREAGATAGDVPRLMQGLPL